MTPREIANTRPEDEEHMDDFSALYRAALEGVSTQSMVYLNVRRAAWCLIWSVYCT